MKMKTMGISNLRLSQCACQNQSSGLTYIFPSTCATGGDNVIIQNARVRNAESGQQRERSLPSACTGIIANHDLSSPTYSGKLGSDSSYVESHPASHSFHENGLHFGAIIDRQCTNTNLMEANSRAAVLATPGLWRAVGFYPSL